ncbi:MAG: helix-turn-helix transcriptional regulator [Planctomycetota bacterium]
MNTDAVRVFNAHNVQLPAALHDVFGATVGDMLQQHAINARAVGEVATIYLTIRGHAARVTLRPYEHGILMCIARSMRPLDIDIEAKPLPGDLGRLDSLTPREAEVLGFIGEGYTSAEIAKRLNRSIKTIEWHRVSIGQKLQTTSRVALALVAQQAGLSKVASHACPLPPE